MYVLKFIDGVLFVTVLCTTTATSIKMSDKEPIDKPIAIFEQPHIPHNNYPVPQYSNIMSTTNSVSGTVSAQTIINYQNFELL